MHYQDMFHVCNVTPRTGLALMVFSWYCPSSLDLANFVVRGHGGATAEPCAGYLWLTALNLEIQESGNPGIWKSGIQKNPKNENCQYANPFCPKCRQGLD